MDRRQLLFGMTALALSRNLPPHFLLSPQDPEPTGQPKNLSDRERAGLRGRVKTCIEDTTTTTEYDPDGRMLSTHTADPDGREWGSTRTYDSSGRLLRTSSRNWDGSSTMQTYSYDEAGRLVGIADGNGDRTSFQYDEQGRKTEIRSIATKQDIPSGAVVRWDMVGWDIDDGSFGFYGAGFGARNATSIKTIYNDHDQAEETQAYDVDGRLLSRLVCTYDEKGRVTRVKEITEDTDFPIPAEQLAKMSTQTRAQLKKAFGALKGEQAMSFIYDSDGRVTEMILHMGFFGFGCKRTRTLNEHGDIVGEHTTFIRDPSVPLRVPFSSNENGDFVPTKPSSEWPSQPDLPTFPTIHYTYQYDSFGNWTEKVEERDQRPFATRRRELTYY